jgi:pilus assembly protein FimV
VAPAAAPAPTAAPAPAPTPVAIAPPAVPAPPPAAAAAPPAVVASPAPAVNAPVTADPARQVKVRTGDTLSRIARANKTAEVSLDQMVVALLRANPAAFIGGNANLLKAGADLTVPSREEAASVPAKEAKSVLALHSRDFDEYRRRLAAEVPRLATNPRQAGGKIEATVSEKKQAPPSRNRLSLSAGGVGRATRAEKSIAAQLATIAKERAARLAGVADAVSRLQEPAPAAGAASAASSPASAGRDAVTFPSR